MALVSLGLLLAALRLTAPAHAEDAEGAAGGQSVACAAASAIPTAECEALVSLYQSTGGPHWENDAGWLNPLASPCTWYGVGCAGGHVTELLLESNHLSGALPTALMAFDYLERLRLADNLLGGEVPPAICALVDTVTEASFDYNQLRAGSRRTRACVTYLDPNWADSQTQPPTDLRVSAIATDSLTLAWTPIRYTADGGYYEIGYSLTPTGPITPHGVTADKSAGSYVLDGLTPGVTHFVHVRTVTPAHANQENEQVSAPATTVATTLAADGAQVLLLIYFPADNDLSPYAPGVVERVRRGSALNPNVQVLMLADRAGDHNTGLLEIANGVVVTSTALLTTWGKDELDTTDP
ncbi:MAG TPA: fibronectin type III domain-containing protein, partial [Caldilineaceae bacterium]|nr:fibronectin type III domain-containing protein [Caldilineaceae bacterium]